MFNTSDADDWRDALARFLSEQSSETLDYFEMLLNVTFGLLAEGKSETEVALVLDEQFGQQTDKQSGSIL
jgi:hypothetical protein